MHNNWNKLAYMPTALAMDNPYDRMPPSPAMDNPYDRMPPSPAMDNPYERMPPSPAMDNPYDRMPPSPAMDNPYERMPPSPAMDNPYDRMPPSPAMDNPFERMPPPPVVDQAFTPDQTLAPGHEIYSYPHNMPGALDLIENAVAAENEDRIFYQFLINSAPSEEEKEIIRGIRENEITHFGLFRQIFSQLTGRMLPVPEESPSEAPKTYCEGIKKALTGEQNAVEKYRRILFAMQNRVHINMMTEIITDELRHGILYNYLYSKNLCKA